MKKKEKPPAGQLHKAAAEVRQKFPQCHKLEIGDDGNICRQIAEDKQIVLPFKIRKLVYKELHEEMGHLSTDRVVRLERQRFYWPNMQRDINFYINNKCKCLIQQRPPKPTRPPLNTITTNLPMELILIDFLHYERSKGGFEYILVLLDHFPTFPQAYAMHFGKALFSQLQELRGIFKSHYTSFHPKGNGQVERFNRMLLSMLRTLPDNFM